MLDLAQISNLIERYKRSF